MANSNSDITKAVNLEIMELTDIIAVPMELNAVARLKIADVIWQGGANAPLSTTEILSHILPSGAGGPENLERILKLLSSYNVFSEHLDSVTGQKKYSLTEIGKTLVPDVDGNSWAPYVLHRFLDPIMMTWPLVHETVLDPTTVPFEKLHGDDAYSYYSKRPEMNELVQKGSNRLILLQNKLSKVLSC